MEQYGNVKTAHLCPKTALYGFKILFFAAKTPFFGLNKMRMKKASSSGYQPEYCQQVIDYFTVEPYKRHTDEQGKETGFPPLLPTVEGFADSLGVLKSTVCQWAKKYPDFAHALSLARQKQHLFMIYAGLAGIYPAPFLLFLMNNSMFCAGYDESAGMPLIHRGKSLRKKIVTIQKAFVTEEINTRQAEALVNMVKAEAHITQTSDFDERIKAIEDREKHHRQQATK